MTQYIQEDDHLCIVDSAALHICICRVFLLYPWAMECQNTLHMHN